MTTDDQLIRIAVTQAHHEDRLNEIDKDTAEVAKKLEMADVKVAHELEKTNAAVAKELENTSTKLVKGIDQIAKKLRNLELIIAFAVGFGLLNTGVLNQLIK